MTPSRSRKNQKSRFTLEEWKKIFERRGIKINKLSYLNSTYNSPKRKDELVDWFDIHNISKDFVVIDDDNSLHALPARLKEHLIITSPLIGLTPEHLAQASAILGAKLKLA